MVIKQNKSFIIAFLQQKGGAGKTTMATNLTCGLTAFGYSTILADGDPQGSSRDWHQANGGQLVDCIGLDRETLVKDIKSISGNYDVIVIDGAPQILKLSAVALIASDLVLIPVQPSPYDIWASADLIELIKTRQAINNGFPKAAFILSRVIKNSRLSKEVVGALKEYDIPVLTSGTSQRVDYATSASHGSSVFSSLGSPAALEMGALTKEIIEKYLNMGI